jgi:iron-sulfur cluster repair protein YtfE (RIC family)
MIEDFPSISLHFTNLFHSFVPSVYNRQLSISDLIQFLSQTHLDFDSHLKSVFQKITNQQPKSIDWMNSIQEMNKNLDEIQQETSKDHNLQNKSLPAIIKLLINQVHELKTKISKLDKKKDLWKKLQLK